MHELTLCYHIVNIASKSAQAYTGKKITDIYLQIGALTCVDVQTLHYSFTIASRDTLAAEAKLHIQHMDGDELTIEKMEVA